MHYIKLLRPPVVEKARSEPILKIVLAITTDLGDAYLSPKEPIDLVVVGAYTAQKDGQEQLVPVNLTQRNLPKWRSGMRVLKIDVPLPPHPIATIQVRPLNRQLTAMGTTDICPPTGQGLIMTAFSDIGQNDPVCFRSLRLPTPDNQTLQVEEDMGDSIARHIWDSGIATASLIADMCMTNNSGTTAMPSFRSLLQRQRQADSPLKILEIGCGIGTLGIAMARILSSCSPPPKVLMTDLAEAEERAKANITRQASAPGDVSSILDFEGLDWEDGKLGVFGEKVQAEAWDLVIVSDCTYNTDTLLPLVQTLSAVHKHSAAKKDGNGPKIFLATKSRHSSEREFFDLMADEGWTAEEESVIPLPHIDGEAKPIEVYLFEKK